MSDWRDEMSRWRDELEEIATLNFEKKAFVSLDGLEKLLSESKIATIVGTLTRRGALEVYNQSEVIKVILNNGRRLFATLLSLSRPEMILKFIEVDHYAHSQLDSRLPLSHHSINSILQDEALSTRFYNNQWRFSIPFFHADQSHRELEESVVLPFTDSELIGKGGLGDVYKMTMKASHQNLSVPEVEGRVRIVRKQLRPKKSMTKDFQKESHILSMLRGVQHPNIIQLLTTYTIHQTHNFLFPLADGDLKDFFGQDHRLPGFETDNAVLQALFEIASAIEAVHDYFSDTYNVHKIGCHYDLKPNNILYRSGKFILSDFGLSRLSDEDEGSNTLYRNGGGEYMAPECVSIHEDFKKLHVGRSSDMWSFGCILSEILTYLQKGKDGVTEFSSQREITLANCWTRKSFHAGDKPHAEVVGWLAGLANWPKITNAQKSLLVLIQRLLQQTPNLRPKAQTITLSLHYIAQKELLEIIDTRFIALLANSALEITIEYMRFQIWGEVNGLKDSDRTCWLHSESEARHFRDLQLVPECLFRLCEEVEKVSELLSEDSQKPFRVFYRVQRIVDELWDMQPSSIRQSMISTLENRILAIEDKGPLESIGTILHKSDTLETRSLGEGSSRETAYRRIGLLATMKQIASAIETGEKSSVSMLISEGQIKTPLKPFHWHSMGLLHTADNQKERILVEWLKYDSAWAERKEELIQRVQDIASFRAPSSTRSAFPVLTCAGYYHSLAKHAFGIVYYFPPLEPNSLVPSQDDEYPISLLNILSTIQSRSKRPSLDQVFSAALSLIKVVLTMHKANWLHKNISSFNIIFFPDRYCSNAAEAMTSPYFIGFSYSRLNLENAFTQGPSNDRDQLDYQHPEYLSDRARFCQEYDYYSVGLVLLELGFWRCLKEIIKKFIGSPAKLQQKLLREYVPLLKTFMGKSYEEAVVACLSGDFGDSSKPAEVREAFERNVLRKVENRGC